MSNAHKVTPLAESLTSFYRGRRVLVTGHTGFKGAWLTLWLRKMGAEPVGVALPPLSPLGIFSAAAAGCVEDHVSDIRDLEALRRIVDDARPEIVFHLAAQALVGTAFADPVTTFSTNVMGTVNVLECVRRQPSVRAAVMITSDKCYENVEQIWGYREPDRLGGNEAYGCSKASAELAIAAFTHSYFRADGTAHVASARAGNVVGGGDWADYRLVPDCVRSLRMQQPVQLRNPAATRPWQFVLEPLAGYLLLGKRLFDEGKRFQGGWNFGPAVDNTNTVELGAQAILRRWGSGTIERGPAGVFHESQLLQLDCAKAIRYLGWKPLYDFERTMAVTADWYKHQFDSADQPMRDLSLQQIAAYEEQMNQTLRA